MIKYIGWTFGSAFISIFAYVAFSTIGQTYGSEPWVMSAKDAAAVTLVFLAPFVFGYMAAQDGDQ